MPAFRITVGADCEEFKAPVEGADPPRKDIHWPTARRIVAAGLRRLADELEQGEYLGGPGPSLLVYRDQVTDEAKPVFGDAAILLHFDVDVL